MKFKIFLVFLVAAVYFGSTYCIFNRDICVAYKDYYLLNNRTVSWKEERAFDSLPLAGSLAFFAPYLFSEPQPDIRFLGFSEAEPAGRWTNGNLAKLSFQLPSVYSDVWVNFNVSPYISQHNPEVYVKVFLNGEEVDEWKFIQGKNYPPTAIKLRQKNIGNNQKQVFSFRIEGSVSPRQLGYGDDIRKLGLLFKGLSLVPDNN